MLISAISMKITSLLAGCLLVFIPALSAVAQPVPPAASAPKAADSPAIADLKDLVTRISAKLRAGDNTEAKLAPELAEFDALLAKYPEKNDETAQIALMRGMLYVQGLNQEAKGMEMITAVKKDYPGTKPAALVDRLLEQQERADAAKAASAALIGKSAPELHFQWSSAEGLKTLSDLKGKVAVLDFWATWCGPCLSSFPQIREHVARFKDAPVKFVGVTSIQGFVANMGPRIDTKGDPEKEMALMPEFMKAKEMTWDVVFSEEAVFNPDYGIQGIPFLAIIAPDGTVRHAGLHPGDPSADVAGKIEAILKEFKLPLPAEKS